MPWTESNHGALSNNPIFDDFLPLPADTRYWVECCYSGTATIERGVQGLHIRHPLGAASAQGAEELPLNPSLMLNRLFPDVGFLKSNVPARLALRQSWCEFASGQPKLMAERSLLRRQRLVETLTSQNRATATVRAEVENRLVVGSGGPHASETSLTLHPQYGFPLIPGSAIKGTVRHARLRAIGVGLGIYPLTPPKRRQWQDAEYGKTPLLQLEHFLQTACPPLSMQEARHAHEQRFAAWQASLDQAMREEYLPIKQDSSLFNANTTAESFDAEEGYIFRAMFGGPDQRGGVTFLDALPESWMYEPDVMTPHFGDWYSSGAAPSDASEPNPILFLTVGRGSTFQFDIIGRDPVVVERVKTMLSETLADEGIGAKTAAGYGFLRAL